MRNAKWTVLLVLGAAGLGLALASSRPKHSAPAAAPAQQPAPSAGHANESANGAKPPAKAPFTTEELLAHMQKAQQRPAPAAAEAAVDPAIEARAQAAMKQGIEAQSPSVQRIYYRAQVNAAPQLIALQQQQLVTLQQNGASAQQIAIAQAALQAATATADKSRAELARLDR